MTAPAVLHDIVIPRGCDWSEEFTMLDSLKSRLVFPSGTTVPEQGARLYAPLSGGSGIIQEIGALADGSPSLVVTYAVDEIPLAAGDDIVDATGAEVGQVIGLRYVPLDITDWIPWATARMGRHSTASKLFDFSATLVTPALGLFRVSVSDSVTATLTATDGFYDIVLQKPDGFLWQTVVGKIRFAAVATVLEAIP